MKDYDAWILQGIVNEKKGIRQFHCALTVTAVAGVAAAGVSAYGAYSQSKAQKDAASAAQAGLDGNPEGAYGRKIDLPNYEDSLGDEPYQRGVWKDFEASLPTINAIAGDVNATAMGLRNRNSGKTFKKNLVQQGENINDMLRGEIPGDVADVIQRAVAERIGGTFDPGAPGGYAGGVSQAGSALARSLGVTSLDIMEKGMSFAPEWEKLVDSFTYTPGKAIADAGTFLSAAQIQLRRDESKYEGEVNQELADAQPDPTVAGSINDRLKLTNIRSQADANQMKALAGLITAGAGGATSIYNAYKPTPTSAGSISPTNLAQSKVPGTWQNNAYGT